MPLAVLLMGLKSTLDTPGIFQSCFPSGFPPSSICGGLQGWWCGAAPCGRALGRRRFTKAHSESFQRAMAGRRPVAWCDGGARQQARGRLPAAARRCSAASFVLAASRARHQPRRGERHLRPRALIHRGGVKQCVRGDRKVTPGPMGKMTKKKKKEGEMGEEKMLAC